MDGMVVNTVQFRFPESSPRPSWTEIATFLKQLNVDLNKMETAYKTSHERSLCVKFTSQEAMAEALEKNTEPRRFEYARGTSVEVRMSIAGRNMRYVRIFDLPPEVSDENVLVALGSYGKVEYLIREKFPANLGVDHMYTGVRGVYMDMEKEIPPMIDIGNRKAGVFHDGLKDVCFLCNGVGHRKNSCPQRPQRRKIEGKKKVSQPVSYATIVSGQETEPDKQEITEVIEIGEDDIQEEGDSTTEIVSERYLQPVTSGTSSEEAKEIRRKEAMEKLSEVAKAFGEALHKQNASQRRAQSSSSGSGSGYKEHSRPKKICARKANG